MKNSFENYRVFYPDICLDFYSFLEYNGSMATTANILTLLKFYASKQKSPIIEYREFGDYLHRYAQHHLDENSELVSFCGASYTDALDAEISQLVSSRSVVVAPVSNKDYIFVISIFVEKFAETYKQIETNISIPFPSITDIPKSVPLDIVTRQPAADIIYRLLDKEELNDKTLYAIVFSKNIPSLLFPSLTCMAELVNCALRKIQDLLHKEETHDYFLKKLSISNPGKELSIKNFFAQFVSNPLAALDVLKNTGDTFYYWSQLCYFLKQDYTKVKDFTPEDITILQSVAVIEVATSYYKTKTSERIQKETAFKTLDNLMLNPPYYYSLADVLKMKDQNGVPLLGQYNEKELKEHLYALTQETVGNQMPELLVFKVNDDEGFYIKKEKVMPLIIRLANDARLVVRESLVKLWYKYLLDYETLPEMKEASAFERCLEREVRSADPILYAILNSTFLPVVAYEDKTPGRISLFRNGNILPYSELLMISRQEILSDAKIKLPFWYFIPVLSWILGLIFRKPKNSSQRQSSSTTATEKLMAEQKAAEAEKLRKRNEADSIDPKLSRKQELRKSAAEIEKKLVPESSTLDRELKGYLHEWNDRLGKQNYDNLTEDINSLIRDYLRKVLRSLKTESFSAERVSSLAQSLVDSPSMIKIKNHPALKRYTELYLVKLVKNIP